jgi:hypothetical protein
MVSQCYRAALPSGPTAASVMGRGHLMDLRVVQVRKGLFEDVGAMMKGTK